MEISHVLSRLNREWSSKTIAALNVALGALLLIMVLVLIRDVLTMAVVRSEKVSGTERKPVLPAKKSLEEYAVILKSNPFGFSAGELSVLSAESGPSASMNDFVLIGTVAGSRTMSYAIFADKAGKQEVFRAGDKVFGAGVLSKVEKDKVVLHSKGRDLDIPIVELTVVKEVGPAANTPSAFGRKTGEASYTIDQQRIQQAIDRPDQLMTDARFVPNILEGRQQGFVLREVKPGGIYHSLGLQNGDVLLKINDYGISNPEAALQAFTALRGIDRAQLDIIRNGAKMTVTYQIR